MERNDITMKKFSASLIKSGLVARLDHTVPLDNWSPP